MAYLDYVGLAYFKSLLDENYLRTDYSGDTTIQGNVTFTEPVDADVKNDYLGNQIDKTYIKDIVLDPEGSGALALVLGDGSVSHLLTNTTVSQVRSFANELYPVLLCYDANAEEAQITKTVKYVHDVQINPSTGYISAKGIYVKHPTFNRRNGVTQKVEWAYDFTDGVTGLGNPMSQVYAYVDPASQGGEHCIELRLYGNPNVSPTIPSVNDSTNTFSIGVGVTGGNVRFGYCPSTPLYLDNGSTLRTEATGHGTDIITRDWLNLNGSLTGLVHTTMNETIDGAKIFKKTVTINSGDNNNKAGLYVQGNSDVHGNEHVYGTETVDGKFTANGTAEIKGGSGNNPSLLVTGNETITGKLTGTGTAEFSGGSGNTPTLTVNGNESVSGNSSVGGNSSITGNETVGGNISTTNGNISTTNGTISSKTGVIGSGGLTVNGNETVNGEIYKVVNNTPQEYVSYVTNKQETKTTIVNNLIKDKGGLAVDNNKNIYVSLRNGGGIVNDNGFLRVDFSVNDDDAAAQELLNQTKNAILSSLNIQIPLTSNKNIYVDKDHANATNAWRNANSGVIDTTVGTQNKPFKSIGAAVSYITQGFSIGANAVTIYIKKGSSNYKEYIELPEYSHTSGYVTLTSFDIDNKSVIESLFDCGTNLSCRGSGWNLYELKFVNNCISPENGRSNFPAVISISGNGSLNIRGCEIDFTYSGNAPTAPTYVITRPITVASGGRLNFYSRENYPTTITCNKGNANSLTVFNLERQGQISTTATNTGESRQLWHDIQINGTATVIFAGSGQSLVECVGGATYLLGFKGNCTGKKCNLNSGAILRVTSDGLPGDVAGTVDSDSFSYASPASVLTV